MTRAITRRSILIMAGASALALSPVAALASGERLLRWRGTALGGSAEMLLDIADRRRGEALLARALAEIERLEGVFSLYRPDSALARLNRAGRLDMPPPELLDVLALARRIWQASKGAFDPMVQPLWDHFAAQGDPGSLKAILPLVDFGHVAFDSERIVFGRSGMAMTLNGIAQGAITDRIADLLAAEGLTHSLIALGEMRALDGRPDGTSWPVGIEGTGDEMPLAGNALAVSRGGGTLLPRGGSHIFDPRTGNSVPASRIVAVRAPRAALADGLSTALMAMDGPDAADLLTAFPGVDVRIHDAV
ncbi:MAG: FAD:protein FMN transferase [Rhodothalassiaceae bacterium]